MMFVQTASSAVPDARYSDDSDTHSDAGVPSRKGNAANGGAPPQSGLPPLGYSLLVTWIAIGLLSACRPTPVPAVTPIQPLTKAEFKGRPIAKVMSFGGASWLERDSRPEEENPEALVNALPIELGDTVVDLGCGSGFYARLLSQRVGDSGRVLCVDIQPEMIELALKLADEAGISNIEFILSKPNDPRLETASVDLLLMVDVYHELADPKIMLEAIRLALVPDGVAALAEYRLEGDSADWIHIEHRMSVDQVKKEWLPAGFELLHLIEELPTQHLFLFTPENQ